MPGDTFRAKWVENALCTVISTDEEKNLLRVKIDPEKEGRTAWEEDGWNLEHTIHGLERGDYFDLKQPAPKLLDIISGEDSFGKKCLKVELTIDGATLLDELISHGESNQHIMAQLHDNKPGVKDTLYLRISATGDRIYTEAYIDWDDEPAQVINEWRPTEGDMIDRWAKNPKEVFYFYPQEKENAERRKDIEAKVKATSWAVYSQESIPTAAIETNNRHNQLKEAYEKIREAMKVFNYKVHKRDHLYYDKLQEAVVEMESEMDVCLAKMKLLKSVGGNDFNTDISVSKAFRNFRKVVEEKTKMNVAVERKQGDQVSVYYFEHPQITGGVHTIQKNKEDAVARIKEAFEARQLMGADYSQPYDETQLKFLREEPYNECISSDRADSDKSADKREEGQAANQSNADTKGENGSGVGEVGKD